jgi:hypothetical protein
METLINSKGFHVVETTTEKKATQTRTLCSGCSDSFIGTGVRQHQDNTYSAGTGAHSPHNDGYVAILLIIFLIIMVVLGHYMKHWYVIITDIPPSPILPITPPSAFLSGGMRPPAAAAQHRRRRVANET